MRHIQIGANMRLVLTNANVIDCVTPDLKTQATVVVEDGRILEILSLIHI